MKLHNIHNHSTFSDGYLEAEEIVIMAKKEKLGVIGITDHVFSNKLSEHQQIKFIDGYAQHINSLKNKYQEIKILAGLEIDFSKKYGIPTSQLFFQDFSGIDYLLFEYVDTKEERWGTVAGRTIEELVKIKHCLNLSVGLAHNDLQKNYEGRESEIAKILAKNDIFVEICQSEGKRNSRAGQDYYRLFSKDLIKAMAKFKTPVAIGTDTHKGTSVSNIKDAIHFISSNNLKLAKILS